jgi:hypothetical protein
MRNNSIHLGPERQRRDNMLYFALLSKFNWETHGWKQCCQKGRNCGCKTNTKEAAGRSKKLVGKSFITITKESLFCSRMMFIRPKICLRNSFLSWRFQFLGCPIIIHIWQHFLKEWKNVKFVDKQKLEYKEAYNFYF